MERFSVFHGEVEKGVGLGKKLGFPTFNLHVDPLPDIPHGVYAVRIHIDGSDEIWHDALMHYGPKPTVNMTDVFCEIFVLDFSDGRKVAGMDIQALGKLRDIQKFDSLELMVEQIDRDRKLALSHYFTL